MRGHAHSGRRDYNRWLAARSVSLPFDRVITFMLRVHSSRDILAELGNRCTWQAVAHWRAGRRRPPAWVLERLAELLRADYEQQLEHLAAVKRFEPGQHPEALRALNRVNAARQNAKRTQPPFPELGDPSKTEETGD